MHGYCLSDIIAVRVHTDPQMFLDVLDFENKYP